MEQSSNTKLISAIISILLVVGLGYLLLNGRISFGEGGNQAQLGATENSNVVTVKNTMPVGGALPPPEGFPEDILLGTQEITESATTYYPVEKLKQLSVSYRSSKTVDEMRAWYRNYMLQLGYEITEEGPNSPAVTITGTNDKTDLHISIDNSENGAVVYLSYVLKLASR